MVEKLDENIRVGVIVVAVGGADIQLFEEDGYQSYINTAADWLKNWAKEYDYNCYKRIIDMAKIAQNDGVIKGILVHQGETNNMQQNWPNRLKAIYENMLSDLNLKGEEVPLLVGETRRDGVCSGHNQVIANVPNVIPNSYVISSEGLEKTNDEYHFSAQGYRDFGINLCQGYGLTECSPVLVAENEDGFPVGFTGIENRTIEMLYFTRIPWKRYRKGIHPVWN